MKERGKSIHQSLISSKILYAVFLSLFFFFFLHPLIPEMRIFVFAPLIVLVLSRFSLLISLWSAFLIGLFLDFLSSSHMGLFATSYTLTTFFIYRYRNLLTLDHYGNFGLFTAFFSFLFTLIFTLLFFLFDRREPISGKWFLIDVLLMPILDGIYGILWIALPLELFERWERSLRLFFLQRKRR